MKITLSSETEQATSRIAERLKSSCPHAKSSVSALVNGIVQRFEQAGDESELQALGAVMVPKSVRDRLRLESLRTLAETMGEDYIEKLRKRAERRNTRKNQPVSADSEKGS
jgi:hypothetical protein